MQGHQEDIGYAELAAELAAEVADDLEDQGDGQDSRPVRTMAQALIEDSRPMIDRDGRAWWLHPTKLWHTAPHSDACRCAYYRGLSLPAVLDQHGPLRTEPRHRRDELGAEILAEFDAPLFRSPCSTCGEVAANDRDGLCGTCRDLAQPAGDVIHVIEGVVIGHPTCIRCGTTDGVDRVTDPFAHEIDGVTEEIDICGPCLQERCDDI